MSSTIRIRAPFYRRMTANGNDGFATFYLNAEPNFLPDVNQRVIITHTDVNNSTGLYTKLQNVSTNTVLGRFQTFDENTSNESRVTSDGYKYFMNIIYDVADYSTAQFGGDCRGYIEYDVNPETYTVLKPIEASEIVTETTTYDLGTGISTLSNKVAYGNPIPDAIIKGMFVKRKDTNTIFANLLKSLNLPVSEEEMKKYTRTPLGKLTDTNSNIFTVMVNGVKKIWTEHISTGATLESLIVHPVTGYTGEYYGTALQSIGTHEFTPTNKAMLPVTNDLYLIFEIPNSFYGEIIDGKTVKFTMPYYTPTLSGTYSKYGQSIYTLVAGSPKEISLYGTYNKINYTNTATSLDRILSEKDISLKDIGNKPNLNDPNLNYESNVVLLFCDDILAPQGSNLSSWGDGYSDLMDGVKVFNPTDIEKATYDHNMDRCVGFVALDKGFVVITHPTIVDSYFLNVFGGNITYNNSGKSYDINNVSSTGVTRNSARVYTDPESLIVTTDNVGDIVWDSTQFLFNQIVGSTSISSNLEYISYNTEKSLNIICLASSNEFYKSTNDTARELLETDINSDYSDFKSDNGDLYPVMITEIGIHDAEGNLLAICKPSQPIRKFWYDIVSFNIKIRL